MIQFLWRTTICFFIYLLKFSLHINIQFFVSNTSLLSSGFIRPQNNKQPYKKLLLKNPLKSQYQSDSKEVGGKLRRGGAPSASVLLKGKVTNNTNIKNIICIYTNKYILLFFYYYY